MQLKLSPNKTQPVESLNRSKTNFKRSQNLRPHATQESPYQTTLNSSQLQVDDDFDTETTPSEEYQRLKAYNAIRAIDFGLQKSREPFPAYKMTTDAHDARFIPFKQRQFEKLSGYKYTHRTLVALKHQPPRTELFDKTFGPEYEPTKGHDLTKRKETSCLFRLDKNTGRKEKDIDKRTGEPKFKAHQELMYGAQMAKAFDMSSKSKHVPNMVHMHTGAPRESLIYQNLDKDYLVELLGQSEFGLQDKSATLKVNAALPFPKTQNSGLFGPGQKGDFTSRNTNNQTVDVLATGISGSAGLFDETRNLKNEGSKALLLQNQQSPLNRKPSKLFTRADLSLSVLRDETTGRNMSMQRSPSFSNAGSSVKGSRPNLFTQDQGILYQSPSKYLKAQELSSPPQQSLAHLSVQQSNTSLVKPSNIIGVSRRFSHQVGNIDSFKYQPQSMFSPQKNLPVVPGTFLYENQNGMKLGCHDMTRKVVQEHDKNNNFTPKGFDDSKQWKANV